MKPIRCVVCRTLFDHKDLMDNKGCPVCGYEGLTMLTNGDLNIDINWFEIRMICMWAEAMLLQIGDYHSMNAFYSTISEIKKQLPDCGKITMFDSAPSADDLLSVKINDSKPPEGTLMN